jgi:hypothetical protein
MVHPPRPSQNRHVKPTIRHFQSPVNKVSWNPGDGAVTSG